MRHATHMLKFQNSVFRPLRAAVRAFTYFCHVISQSAGIPVYHTIQKQQWYFEACFLKTSTRMCRNIETDSRGIEEKRAKKVNARISTLPHIKEVQKREAAVTMIGSTEEIVSFGKIILFKLLRTKLLDFVRLRCAGFSCRGWCLYSGY